MSMGCRQLILPWPTRGPRVCRPVPDPLRLEVLTACAAQVSAILESGTPGQCKLLSSNSLISSAGPADKQLLREKCASTAPAASVHLSTLPRTPPLLLRAASANATSRPCRRRHRGSPSNPLSCPVAQPRHRLTLTLLPNYRFPSTSHCRHPQLQQRRRRPPHRGHRARRAGD